MFDLYNYYNKSLEKETTEKKLLCKINAFVLIRLRTNWFTCVYHIWLTDFKINSWIIKEKIYDHRRHIDMETWPKLRYKHFHTKAIFVCAPTKCKDLKSQNNLNLYTSDLLDKTNFGNMEILTRERKTKQSLLSEVVRWGGVIIILLLYKHFRKMKSLKTRIDFFLVSLFYIVLSK